MCGRGVVADHQIDVGGVGEISLPTQGDEISAEDGAENIDRRVDQRVFVEARIVEKGLDASTDGNGVTVTHKGGEDRVGGENQPGRGPFGRELRRGGAPSTQ